MKFIDLFENTKLDDIYNELKKDYGNKSDVIHAQLKSKFENKYVRWSNKEMEYLWALYKKDKSLK